MLIKQKIFAYIVFILFLISLTSIATFSQSHTYTVNFGVTLSGYVTVYISGICKSNTVILHYGIENGPQQSWTEVFNKEMSWDGSNFTATIGPFNNGTWIAWVFYDNTTGQWINYNCHPFWNWNLEVNPTNVGQTYATVLQNGSILITAIGRAPDDLFIHYGLTTGPQTGLSWTDISCTEMQYNPLWGNYSIIIGPFQRGQWVQWVYHDQTINSWIHNTSCTNFAIQDIYSPISVINSTYNKYVYTEGENTTAALYLNNEYGKSVQSTFCLDINSVKHNFTVNLKSGINEVNLTFSTKCIPQGIYYPTLKIYYNNSLCRVTQLQGLYILNVTNKKPLSFVLVWNMHQPLYVAPNGSWEQPWVWLHTGQDFYWNGQLVGSYELQAMLINEFNVAVTIDFTPVLLYQWETILHERNATFTSNFGVNVTHDLIAVNYTLNLFRKLVQENKVDVLTVPFYHPLQPLLLEDGYWSDVQTQILMGKNMTKEVFGVCANGTWTPEMAFCMALVGLYNESNISYTILDCEAFLPYVTLVNGTINPDEPFIVENNLGQTIYVLFRNTTLSNEFGFKFFSQSPQLTAKELIQQLAQIYMSKPGGVVTVALDGENPLIFNPTTGPSDLYAIYSSLSHCQGKWLITQTASEAIKTHKPTALITNLPVNSWDLNLDYWNNGCPGKIEVWQNLSLAREYLVAYTVMLGKQISPEVSLLFNDTPNSTALLYTLWNYLYVAEGSDWTWQTGAPAHGPIWFKEQAILYTTTIVNITKAQFSKINITCTIEGVNCVIAIINNNLQHKIVLNIVANNGTHCVCKTVELRPGINIITLCGISGKVTICMYSPVTKGEIGDAIVPINSHGFLIQKTIVNQSLSCLKVNKIEYIVHPQELILLPGLIIGIALVVFIEKGIKGI
ncbi:glycoside hydrolase family 57 protein [Acidianus sp. HS-5]|uniref:glycoside hydrolase family 57 protein n=1 Tax=Acidianus sp. HS-5 TaxID=2886040 RepID=UPI001F291E64|nr:glycoside hydrolase family 57 protein [Acidianus sp. HS-5]